MSEKCGNCGSHNLGPDDWDLWHYMKTVTIAERERGTIAKAKY